MDDLVASTGISRRTIYRYFRSKEEIVSSVLEDFITTVAEKIQQALDSTDNPVNKIINVVREITLNIKLVDPLYLYDLQKHYPHLWEKIEQFRAERIQRVFEGFLANNEQNCFRKVHPKIFTTVLLASIRSVINPAFIVENNLRIEDAIQSLFTIFLYGIVEGNHDKG